MRSYDCKLIGLLILFVGEIFRIFALLSSLTSCVNPWIYLGFNRNLRAVLIIHAKKIILRRKNVTIDRKIKIKFIKYIKYNSLIYLFIFYLNLHNHYCDFSDNYQ